MLFFAPYFYLNAQTPFFGQAANGCEAEFAEAVRKSGLELIERFDILVNGKKAAIFVMKKPGEPSEQA